MDKKICHITIGHTRYDGRIFEKECISLQKEGFEVVLIVNDDKDNEKKNNVDIISVNCPLGSKIKRLKAIKALYEKALEVNAELYHLHEPDLLMFARKLKKKGKKVIFDSHEFYPMQFAFRGANRGFAKKIILKLYYLYETFFCKRIDAVIFPEKEILYKNKIIEPFEGRANKVITVGNYPVEYILKKKIRSNEKFTVVYAGSLSEERKLFLLYEKVFNS